MEIGIQIKNLRMAFGFSQDELAEKIYVSRQTISNWENAKSYPDIKSLLLISQLFNVTLDTLVKGDIEKMKQEVSQEDKKEFHQLSGIFAVLLLGIIILPFPLAAWLGKLGWFIWGVIVLLGLFYGAKVEKYKKNFDMQTYKEILAFTEGKPLDLQQKNQEIGKRRYQKFCLFLFAGLLSFVVGLVMIALLW